jgi:hypothetical protein
LFLIKIDVMAGTWRAELVTVEQIMNYYNGNEGVHYKVYAGNTPSRNMLRYSFDGSNKTLGEKELFEAVTAIEQNKLNYNQYTLQILQSEAKVRAKADKRSSLIDDSVNIVFQLNFPQNSNYNTVIQPYNGGQMAGTVSSSKVELLLEKMMEQQNALLSLMTAKIESDTIGSVEVDAPMTIGERVLEPLLGLLENPILQEALAAKIVGFVMPQKAVAMAGINVDDNDKLINEAVAILKNYSPTLGNDLMKLANIALNDVSQFNMLLTVLRGN